MTAKPARSFVVVQAGMAPTLGRFRGLLGPALAQARNHRGLLKFAVIRVGIVVIRLAGLAH